MPLKATVTPSARMSLGIALTIDELAVEGSAGRDGPASAQPALVGPTTVRLPVTATAFFGTPPASQIFMDTATLLASLALADPVPNRVSRTLAGVNVLKRAPVSSAVK